MDQLDRLSTQDIRQMLKGEHKSQQSIQVGYEGETVFVKREIGDTWTDEDGNTWEQREGYKVKHGKFDDLRRELRTFTNCRREECTCHKPNRLDEKMRVLHGMCFDCVVEYEHELRLENKFDDYAREKVRNNALAWLKEAEADKDAIIAELSKMTFVNEFGKVENWQTGINPEELKERIESEFESFKTDFIAKLEKGIETPNEGN